MTKKAIEVGMERIMESIDEHISQGVEPFDANWHATLEMILLMMEKAFTENPGQLLPAEINGKKEWHFYVDVLCKTDLPPDTCAVMITPSFKKSFLRPIFRETGINQSKAYKEYSLIISRCNDSSVIMQVSLPGAVSVGVDVFENGRHFADYTYNSVAECLDDLSRLIWTFFKPSGTLTKKQVIQYTENWLAKSTKTFNLDMIPVHYEYSYIHNPKLIGKSHLNAIFRAVYSKVLLELENLDNLIEMKNELNEDMEENAPIITKAGVLADNIPECQEIMDAIDYEIDSFLEVLRYIPGVRFEYTKKNANYRKEFDKTAIYLYERLTGRKCPEPLKKQDRWGANF